MSVRVYKLQVTCEVQCKLIKIINTSTHLPTWPSTSDWLDLQFLSSYKTKKNNIENNNHHCENYQKFVLSTIRSLNDTKYQHSSKEARPS